MLDNELLRFVVFLGVVTLLQIVGRRLFSGWNSVTLTDEPARPAKQSSDYDSGKDKKASKKNKGRFNRSKQDEDEQFSINQEVVKRQERHNSSQSQKQQELEAPAPASVMAEPIPPQNRKSSDSVKQGDKPVQVDAVKFGEPAGYPSGRKHPQKANKGNHRRPHRAVKASGRKIQL